MNFCSKCGSTISLIVPKGDHKERFVCNECDHIHYVNPRVVSGCLPVFENKVLLCKRAIEPRYGFWTLPAGYLENGETIANGAARETKEEANAIAMDLSLYTVFSLPHISQIYMFFLSRLEKEEFSSGEESLDVKLFDESDIPWDSLSFPVVTQTLEFYFEDRKTQNYPVRYIDLHFNRKN